MSELTQTQTALRGASVNAQKALDALSDPELAHFSGEEKTAWAMAAMIHCDVCRLVVALDECRQPGLARLLWMSDISSKLYEAKEWYFQTGAKLLNAIAEKKPCGTRPVRARLKDLRISHPIAAIDKFSVYRNKVGYHYDPDSIAFIQRFGAESAEEYFDILKSFVLYSGGWAALAKQLIQGRLGNAGTQ